MEILMVNLLGYLEYGTAQGNIDGLFDGMLLG